MNAKAFIEAQTAIIESQPIVCDDGCEIRVDALIYRYSGRVYILPESAYRALLLTP